MRCRRLLNLYISNNKLTDRFQEHFEAWKPALEQPPELAHPEEYPNLNDIKVEVKENQPDEKELEDALHTFKNNKNSGTDKLKTEELKYNSSKKPKSALYDVIYLDMD